MIAFIREPEKPPRLPGVRRVRHFLASTLLTAAPAPSARQSAATVWRAWLFTAWVTAVAVWCVVHAIRCLC